VLFKRRWSRRFLPLAPHAVGSEPFVSIHLACCNEPPEMVIATIDSLAAMQYGNFEVLVLDNNTKDEALWRPLEARCAELGPRFRFFHLENWPGFKAGALNFGLKQTDPRAEVVGVVDADYVVSPDWLSCLIPHFDAPDVGVVQAPQAHRDWETQPFRRMCNWEFEGFFRIGMHHRNERNALIQHGTMTLVRRLALEEVGGWSEWCICEDTELGLRLIEKGYDTRYVDHILGRGLTPSDFPAIKSQRFRWAFGAMQILKHHLPAMLGPSRLNLAQRYHFLTGWFAWLGDALQLVFAFGSLIWTIGMLYMPNEFGLPVSALALPILAFMAFKGGLGPILYRRTMDAPWKDILGASILSVGLAHAIARGVFAGLLKKRGEFVRTPKGWKDKGTLAFFSPIREELGLLFALILGSGVLVWLRGANDLEAQLWVGILALQCIPYLAAIGCQIASYMPDTQPPPALAPAAPAAGVAAAPRPQIPASELHARQG
jgi:cellulose synthase/poly-beta-1,6-N-acetylglucosamine synthase-like glycosyltransferase